MGPDKDTEVVCIVDVIGAPGIQFGIPQRRQRIHPFKWTEYTINRATPRWESDHEGMGPTTKWLAQDGTHSSNAGLQGKWTRKKAESDEIGHPLLGVGYHYPITATNFPRVNVAKRMPGKQLRNLSLPWASTQTRENETWNSFWERAFLRNERILTANLTKIFPRREFWMRKWELSIVNEASVMYE